MSAFRERTVVVTGGASGIGRAAALRFAELGARVFVGDFDPLPESEALFAERGIHSLRCDVRREADVERLIGTAAESGRLDVLVNNAGIGLVKPITEVSEAQWDRVLDTNFKGAFLGCKHAICKMQPARSGAIVNVASNAGILPRAHDPVYSISKAALVALTKSLALCHARDGIRINAVCPGPVGETRMMQRDLDAADDPQQLTQTLIDASPLAAAMGRMSTPEEIADSIVYLASDRAAMVTGTALAIDGGKSLGVPPKADG